MIGIFVVNLTDKPRHCQCYQLSWRRRRCVCVCVVGTGAVSHDESSVGLEPWFISTLVILTSAVFIFALILFTVCFCRRRDLHHSKSTYRSAGTLTYTDLLTYIVSCTGCQEVSFWGLYAQGVLDEALVGGLRLQKLKQFAEIVYRFWLQKQS